MVQVTINVPVGLQALPHVVTAALPEIAEALRGEIVALAQRELHTGGADYVQGLRVIHVPVSARGGSVGPQVFATLVLTGWLANAIEAGWAGGDMKPGLLAGRNARTGKDGTRYNIVPFRHGTPGSSGRSAAVMGEVHREHGMSRSDAAQLGKRIHAAARKLAPTTSHPGQGSAPGGHLPAGLAPKLSNRTSGYQHKTDIFAGMARKEKTYVDATQNSYGTFRIVSDKSDPGSWIHPGIARHDFFGRSAGRVPGIAALIFDGILAGMEG